MFNLVSKYSPSGDQPEAIKKLVEGVKNNGGEAVGLYRTELKIIKNIKFYLEQQVQVKLLLLLMLLKKQEKRH